MPHDPLQIALEHHRSGRVQQAEAGYRGILADEPGNAEAMHWLGVLSLQAGQGKEAVFWLEQAAAMRLGDAAFQHNLAQAYLAVGNTDQAIKTLERAASAQPGQAEPLMALALARLSRGLPGDAEAVVARLTEARDAGLNSSAMQHQLGLALLAAGQPLEAVEAFRGVLQKEPENAGALYHLALAHRAAAAFGPREDGEAREVRKCLIKALELQPGMAQAWCGLATLDAEAGRMVEAAALYRRAIAAKRDYPAAYQGLGRVLQASGKREEALTAFGQAVRASRGQLGAPAPKPDSVAALERKLTMTQTARQFHYALAALKNIFPPTQVPPEAIAGLFDKYASYFDDHLVRQLEYRVPELIAQAVAAAWEGKPVDVLDLGCGTGLCGPLLRPMAQKLAGVDLSPGMVDKARERGVYDHLEVAELVAAMQQAPRGYDLLVAADVLIYLGDLFPVFNAAAACLRPGGQFAFSVEAGGGERFNLTQKSRRFTHSKPYLEKLAAMHGFEQLRFDSIVARQENEKPVIGYLVILHSPGA